MKTKKQIFAIAVLLVAVFTLAGCQKEPTSEGGGNSGGSEKPVETTYKVFFKANGGTGNMVPQIFAKGETKALKTNTFTYDYNVFIDWNTAANGSGTSYADEQEVTLSNNLTLYAQWMPVTCKVTFGSNGGVGEMEPQIICAGIQQRLTANTYTLDNCWFYGWNTSADGTGTLYSDCQQVIFTEDVVLYAQWRHYGGELNGHEWVDLGLPSRTLWATCNIGADSPTAYGDYFAWGETSPQANNAYDWESYKYANDDCKKLTKYCNNPAFGNNGFTDTFVKLQPDDDAATVNWGNGWRMPTTAEVQELREQCSYAWTTQNGINGRLITGPNGNSFFLPAAGSINNGYANQTGNSCYCWTSTLYVDYPGDAWSLYFFPDSFGKNFFGRDNGFSVRPVCSGQ